MGSERERAEAKKQSLAKQDRERTLADFKKFGTSFNVSHAHVLSCTVAYSDVDPVADAKGHSTSAVQRRGQAKGYRSESCCQP